MAKERIDKIVGNHSSFSRSEIRKMIKDGRIKSDGVVVTNSSEKFDDEASIITVDNIALTVKKHIYIMMNKPAGIVSASEGRGQKTVVDILPDELKRKGLFPAGRLDKDTTGFVLITDDGDFAHKILSPKNHIDKTYIVSLSAPADNDRIKQLEKGITLHDGTIFQPSEITGLNDERTMFKVVIHEGKYHQIKRMFKAIGTDVVALERTKMGNLMLDASLSYGMSREITEDELKLIVG